MRILDSCLSALNACVAVTLLAGCGGSQPPVTSPGAPLQSSAIGTKAATNHSRQLPASGERNLLYVTWTTTAIYTYPKGKFVSSLNIAGGPMCSNSAGDVFITTNGGVAEYPHGGATQIAFITAPFGNAYSCSVDPTTGDLGVYAEYGGNGLFGVAVYRPERHHRWHLHHEYRFAQPQHACSYDSAGDLFVGGFTSGSGLSLEELPKGGSNFETITLDTKVTPQGDIQWDGRYLAIGDYGDVVIHRFAIKGTKGTQVGSLTLSHTNYIRQFWIQGGILIGSEFVNNDVGFWRYPQGGAPVKTLEVSGASGVTISLAPH